MCRALAVNDDARAGGEVRHAAGVVDVGPRASPARSLRQPGPAGLTDPKRLRLIDALRTEERRVSDLAQQVGMSLPNASQHLSVLRTAGLVASRRAGTTVYCQLVEPQIAEACDIVHRIVADRLAGTRLAAGGQR